LLLEQNPKIEIAPPPTNAPIRLPPNKNEIDDLNFHLKKKIIAKNRTADVLSSTTDSSFQDGVYI
jgi:hypothetical protein